MADQSPSLPAFATAIIAESDEGKRVDILDAVHPDYAANVEDWQVLIDAFEGAGGFQTGSYLWRYRNEIGDDYNTRCAMARYHNYSEALIDLYVRYVFSQAPNRQTNNQDLADWWEDVDGSGTHIDDYLRRACALGLAPGHVGVLMDMTQDVPDGPAKADQVAKPFLVTYTATAIPDWRMTRDTLTGVKLLEDVPHENLAEPAAENEDERRQYLLWDTEGWARFDHKGELIGGDTPGLDLVPLAVLRPKPSVLKPFLGRPLLSNAGIVKALFNRMSEQDEVLRNQAFSLLTVQANTDVSVTDVKSQLGTEFGTTRAICVQGDVKYISPDMKVPETIGLNIQFLIREVYRIAHMRFERDSLDAESAEAIRLQYAELNEVLQGLAAALQKLEMELCRFYFAWTSATPEQAKDAFKAADISIEYADEFFLQDLSTDLKAWADAIAMGLGETFEKRIKKRATRRIEPEMPMDVREQVDKEIEALPTAQEEEEAQREAMAAQARARFGGAAA